MYNYTGYGMNPYQQQLTQNRIAQMFSHYGTACNNGCGC